VVVTEQHRRQLAPQIAHLAGELRKAEVHQPVELAHPVPKVLAQPIAKPDQLAQFLRRPIGQPAGRRLFLRGDARDPHCIDGVGLVRCRSSPAKRCVRSGFNSATAKPAAISAANRFFQ
jgi:hypothetical protein